MTAAAPTLAGMISGIRVLHIDKPGLTRATLHIGVGWADETFATRGVTHVVEHLVMHGTTRGRFETNATVDRFQTSFWGHGPAEQVGTFLNEVAAAVRELPLDHLEHEARVLQAEAAGDSYGPHELMFKARYGHQGLGLGIFPGAGPLATDPAVVSAHLARWFVRGNAVLTVIGPMPTGIDLTLPEGDAPARTFPEICVPGALPYEVTDPMLSFVLPEGPAVVALVGAMSTRLEEELRHGHAHAYGFMTEILRLPGSQRVLVQIGARCAPDAVKQVTEAMVAELAHRGEIGFTADERDEMLEWWDLAEQDGGMDPALENAAERVLCGLPVPDYAEIRAAAESLDPAEAAALIREARSGALLLVPEGVEVETPLPEGGMCTVNRTMSTKPLRRRFRSAAPKGTALGFDGDLVEFRDEDGDVHAVRLDEVVGVAASGPDRELVGRLGCFIAVVPRDFAGADEIVRAIDECVPREYFFDVG